MICCFFFYLILYVPVNIFEVMSGWVSLGLTSTKQRIKCLAQEHNAAHTVRLQPATPQSGVKHTTTESLCSLENVRQKRTDRQMDKPKTAGLHQHSHAGPVKTQVNLEI